MSIPNVDMRVNSLYYKLGFKERFNDLAQVCLIIDDDNLFAMCLNCF